MRAASASSTQTDAYRAGCEVGEGLRSLSPEVVLLFTSIHYEHDFPGLFEGMQDGLGSGTALLFGGTGDGIYETARAANQGVSALGLNSGGAVQWTTAVQTGAQADPHAAAQRCGKQVLEQLGTEVNFAFVMAAGQTVDCCRLIQGLQALLPVPIIGGLAGDDRKFQRSFLFANGQVQRDAVGVLAGRGPISWLMNAASGWRPADEPGVVEAAHDNIIQRISGVTAMDFMRDRLGKSPSHLDMAVVPLATTEEDAEGYTALRSAFDFDPDSGAITVMGGIPVGARVQVCEATRAEVVAGVDEVLQGLPLEHFQPVAALVVSCAGRKWVMGDRGQEELNRLQAKIGATVPLTGFPSFGEMAPFRRPDGTYTPTQFHNVTFAVCLIGA